MGAVKFKFTTDTSSRSIATVTFIVIAIALE